METGIKIDVELYGGPLDGHEVAVLMLPPGHDVYLFRTPRGGGGFDVWAYQWANTTTDSGKRWMLKFLFKAARQGGSGEGQVPSEK